MYRRRPCRQQAASVEPPPCFVDQKKGKQKDQYIYIYITNNYVCIYIYIYIYIYPTLLRR